MQETIPDLNLFMVCHALQPNACAPLPPGYHFDLCRQEELEIWKAFPFDDEVTARQYNGYMTEYFDRVYRPRKELFFSHCLFVRDSFGNPVGTCFLWRAYGQINTLHWFKVKKDWEGQGIGRALLTKLLCTNRPDDFPIYLHTQPASYRAIKLYSDFGFSLITDPTIGARENHLEQCLPILKKHMLPEAFNRLCFCPAPKEFLQAVSSSAQSEF